MAELLRNLFASESFIPHGHCYLWKPGLVWLHILSDSLIAIAYYSIPLALLYFVSQRRDLPFNELFILLGAFIVACGTNGSVRQLVERMARSVYEKAFRFAITLTNK